MREVQRDHARSQAKVQKLQSMMEEADERCAALNRFWDLLVEDLRVLVKHDLLVSKNNTLFDAAPLATTKPTLSVFSQSLQERNNSLKTILHWVVSLSPDCTPGSEELQGRCHKLAEEAATLRAQLNATLIEKDKALEELAEFSQKLRRAEKKFDRMHSATVRATELSGKEKEEEAEKVKVEAAEAELQVAQQRKEKAETELAGPPVNGAASGESEEELEAARSLADSRLRELEDARNEITSLRHEVDRLKQIAHQISDEQIAASPIYRELHNHFEHVKEENARIAKINETVLAENVELREKRVLFEKNAQNEANALVDDLRTTLKAHEADVSRLRGQRDDAQAEIMERKSRETVRRSEVDHLKELAHTKELRIATLKQEVRRVQMALASRNGDATLLQKLQDRGVDDDIEIIAELQTRLKSAEEGSEDLRRQLDARSSSTSEQDLIAKVSSLQSQLDKLSDLLVEAGAASTPQDARKTLLSQQKELDQLRQELSTANTSTTALCDELDKLGEAYSESQKVASARIVEIGRMEEKVARLVTEKSKADNKYFSAMRAKDAVENERRVAMRNVERQLRVIEQYSEAEKAFQTQLTQNAEETTKLRTLTNELNTRIAEQQRNLHILTEREREASSARQRAEDVSRQRIDEFHGESRARVEAQERCNKLQKDLDKCRKQIASASSGRRKGESDDMQIEYLNVSV